MDVRETVRKALKNHCAAVEVKSRGERTPDLMYDDESIADAILAALKEAGYAVVPEQQAEALEIAGAWLNRWASHVGSCQGGEMCTCGLTRVRYDVRSALAAAQEQEGE